jgi:hypothetical protein
VGAKAKSIDIQVLLAIFFFRLNRARKALMIVNTEPAIIAAPGK